MKKAHWKTKEKRLAQESEAVDVVETGRGYHIFDSRASLVGYAGSIEEAEKHLAQYPKGWKTMV